MSLRPCRYCQAKNCNKLHRNKRYCDEHIKLANNHQSKTTSNKIYNNRSWKKYSLRKRREKVVCVNFRECGGLAELVDHIKPVAMGGDMWDESNHQVMCHRCHNRKRQGERYNLLK